MSTSDIQKKLKAAIARRLKELDVYVEDELPDYVMVMVANKKERKAMRNDLSLFLGANTDTFVNWLFDVIAKLHSASSSSGKTENVEKKPDPKQQVIQKAREPSPSREKERLKEREREKEKEREKERKAREEKEKAEQQREKERKERERRHKEEQEKAERRAKKEREEKAEEERRRAKEKEAKEHARRLEREREIERERQQQQQQQQKQREMEERARHEEKQHKHRHRRDRSNTWSDDEDGVRPRHRIASVVEKFDPEPPVPSVSSRVVVKRKPQPVNDAKSARGATSILQRAVAAANQSANTRGPTTTSSSSKRPRIVSRIDYRSGSDNEEMEDEEEEEKDEDAMLMAAIGAAQNPDSSSTSSTSNTKFIITMKPSQHPRMAMKRPIATQSRDHKSGERHEKEDVEKPVVKEKRPRHERITPPDESYVSPPKYVEKKRAMVAPSFSPIKPLAQSSPKKEREDKKVHTPIQWDGQIKLDAESSDDDEAQIDAVLAATRRIIKAARNEESDEERLPPTALLSRGNSYSSNYSPVPQVPPEAVYVPTPITSGPSPTGNSPIVEPVVQYPSGPSNQVLNKVNEKCKYWPNCTRGFSCGFAHPSKTCSSFPNCTFGLSCLYIHPPCKYNTQCTNPKCAYTHSATGIFPAAVLALASQSTYTRPSAIVTPMMKPEIGNKHVGGGEGNAVIRENNKDHATETVTTAKVPTVPCIYGAGCKNPRCGFKHPPACKFGLGCYNANCTFYHGPSQAAAPASTSARAQYKWKAN